MKRTVTLLALLAAFCCFLTVTAGAEAAIVDSGTCGENLTWTLDGEGTLRIAGEGAMGEYSTPWKQSRDNIKTVVIERGVTAIGGNAFRDCSILTSVTFAGDSQLTIVGNYAFCDCSSLTNITIPESVTTIGNSAFRNCSILTGVTFVGQSQLTTIGNYAFYNCSDLVGITIPEGVTAIDGDAFGFCDSLISVTFAGNSQLTTIGNYAFYNCSDLTDVTIPESVTTIGRNAFESCRSLTNVYITDLDAWCRIDFANDSATPMSHAQNIWLNGQKIISVIVPNGVTEVKAYTFCGFKDLIQVTIPESVTTIGDSAFYECRSLTDITIPEGVTAIGGGAFGFCDSLTDVYITNLEAWCRISFTDSQATPMCYAKNIYLNGEQIVSVIVPEDITAVKAYTFYGFKNLIQVTIPESITIIGSSAFQHCRSLTDVTIPEGVTAIADDAFGFCDSLISVTFAENSQLTAIGDSAFCSCSSLTNVTIPESITSIGANAFWHCTSLPNITIPKNVTTIGDYAFGDCRSLTSIEIPEGVTVIQPGVFSGASSIQRVALPKSLKGVLPNAFDGCTNIKEVFYAGNEAEWKALPISSGNDPLKNAPNIYFNSTLDDYYCRISVQVSGGGRVTVDHTTAKVGETVTVTAAPYQGYELTAICVDGAEIEGNTFTVTKNHVVSAVFTRLPVTGGNEDFRLEGLSVRTAAGKELQELPQGSILVTVAVQHLNANGSGTILLAQYDSQGRYRGLMWLTLDEMPQGMTLRVTLPVDNSSGEIANLKVFVVEDLTSPLPVGTPVSFGQV